jgi:hypothetical protein
VLVVVGCLTPIAVAVLVAAEAEIAGLAAAVVAGSVQLSSPLVAVAGVVPVVVAGSEQFELVVAVGQLGFAALVVAELRQGRAQRPVAVVVLELLLELVAELGQPFERTAVHRCTCTCTGWAAGTGSCCACSSRRRCKMTVDANAVPSGHASSAASVGHSSNPGTCTCRSALVGEPAGLVVRAVSARWPVAPDRTDQAEWHKLHSKRRERRQLRKKRTPRRLVAVVVVGHSSWRCRQRWRWKMRFGLLSLAEPGSVVQWRQLVVAEPVGLEQLVGLRLAVAVE